MSGESGRSSRPTVGQQVRPEPVVEKTLVENVAGFIYEVAPQTYSNPLHYEGKESIVWVKFDYCDINDLARFRDKIEVNGNSPPLLLIIGYTCGVQAWVIPVNGEAVEVLSWRQGAVRTMKVLPSPCTSASTVDHYSLKRPIIALCDTAGQGPHFCSVSFISLKTGEQVKVIKFKHPVHDIQANKNVIVITFLEKLAVFDASTLEDTFTVTTCFPCPGPNVNPVALGDRWLAYADRRLVPLHQSCGGMVAEGATSYKATVFHAAKSLTKGLKELSESVASNLMGQRGGPPSQQAPPTNLPTPGIVTIVDTQMVGNGEISLLNNTAMSGIVAHYCAHQGMPIVALSFDPSGMLLFTADKQGHNFHIFRLHPHPLSSAQCAVHHLYTLHRGDTTAKVTDISFSLDSRWVAVSTHRGTTHVYPITSYGGHIGVRTHTSSCVVNRLSRFHRSAGLDDTPSSGRNSPVLSASPSSSKFAFELSPNLAYPNPRYPPYPTPTVVKPLVQLKQPLLQNLIGTMGTGPSPSRSPPTTKSTKASNADDIIKVASVFGSPRGWLAGSPTVPRDKQRRTMDSLFVMAYHGNLLEYHLEPHSAANIPLDKITEDSPIELEVHASAQWALVRESTSVELRPPLDLTSPLLTPLSPTRPRSLSPAHSLDHDDPEERWMAQVEIHTHAGPHRRLWMGPQFSFKSIPGMGHGYGGGGVQGGYEGTAITTTSTVQPPRSSPVNMPGSGGANVAVLIEAGSLTGSHDQSPRLLERYSGDSDSFDPEIVMTQLRHDLADAMLDTQHPSHCPDTGAGATTVQEATSHESTLDMTDVMDISCDPPGPSTGRMVISPPVSRGSSRPASHVGEEVQAITTRLSQVPVTPSSSARASPRIHRTPSLEDNRALTSSAEELSTTLGPGCRGAEPAESVWVPIDRPEVQHSSKSPEFTVVDRPEAVVMRCERLSSTSPRGNEAVEHTRRAHSLKDQGQRPSCRDSDASVQEETFSNVDLNSPVEMSCAQYSVKLKAHSRASCSAGKYKISPDISTQKQARSKSKSEDLIRLRSESGPSEGEDSTEQVIVGSGKKTVESVEPVKPVNRWSQPVITSASPHSSVTVPQEASHATVAKSELRTDGDQREMSASQEKPKLSTSATTSEDDLWPATEKKNATKKKKKKNKLAHSDEGCKASGRLTADPEVPQSRSDAAQGSGLEHRVSSSSKCDDELIEEAKTEIVPDIEIDNNYFQTTEYCEPEAEDKGEEFDDFQKDYFQEPSVEQVSEAAETAKQNLEDFELHLDEEDNNAGPKDAGGVMLRSLHDENDLAKALEEAYSSDDNAPIKEKAQSRSLSRSRTNRTSEMFPFRDDTSDDEEQVQVRRRVVVSATVSVSATRLSATEETSTDDRGETSGDDRGESSTEDRRTATSESDVGASPNPRANSASKGKKKKKKKR